MNACLCLHLSINILNSCAFSITCIAISKNPPFTKAYKKASINSWLKSTPFLLTSVHSMSTLKYFSAATYPLISERYV
uniref:Uncharacterized protein n=1 Tax=Arundo donax TaxID=35708 RepID=A0A0A9DJ58_ARUDO